MEITSAIPLTIDPFYGPEYNHVRRLKAILISSVLNTHKEFIDMPYLEQINLIKQLENSCSNESIRKSRDYNLRCVWDNQQFVDIYHSICYNIVSVLDSSDNTLFKSIINKTVNLSTVANMSSKELTPEKYNDLNKMINRRVNTAMTVKFTLLYQCKKCKRNKTTSERIQNRSNDESSSFYITCLFCGTNWFE